MTILLSHSRLLALTIIAYYISQISCGFLSPKKADPTQSPEQIKKAKEEEAKRKKEEERKKYESEAYAFELLERLRTPGSGVTLRGIGKCMGRFFFFLNKPYVYMGTGEEMAYSIQEKKFIIMKLVPDRLTYYGENPEMVDDICSNQNPCPELNQGVHFSVYEKELNCYMVARKDNHDLTVYWFDNKWKMFTSSKPNYTGGFGIPFSSCSPYPPYIRYIFYGKFQIVSADCNVSNEYNSRPFYASADMCKVDLKKDEDIREDKLTYEMDYSHSIDKTYQYIKDSMSSKPFERYIFGACLDFKYMLVTKDFRIYLFDLFDHKYGFFGYDFKSFERRTLMGTVEELFDAFVVKPKAPATTEAFEYEESTAPRPTEVVSTFIVSVYTEPAPGDTERGFSGMPEITVAKWITYIRPIRDSGSYHILTPILVVIIALTLLVVAFVIFFSLNVPLKLPVDKKEKIKIKKPIKKDNKLWYYSDLPTKKERGKAAASYFSKSGRLFHPGGNH